MPASCSDIRSCSNIATDGEYWIYPMAANGKRTKIFCHDLANEPSHFITLSNINYFIQHDASNWIPLDRFQQCQANFKMPLKSVEFRKIRIGIEVIQDLYYYFNKWMLWIFIIFGHVRIFFVYMFITISIATIPFNSFLLQLEIKIFFRCKILNTG